MLKIGQVSIIFDSLNKDVFSGIFGSVSVDSLENQNTMYANF